MELRIANCQKLRCENIVHAFHLIFNIGICLLYPLLKRFKLRTFVLA